MESNGSSAREANRLYWQTETSVADIAEQLGVSRRALYELIKPESSGATCGECGGDLTFANRSARSGGLGKCQQCGSECVLTQELESSQEDAEVVEESVPPYVAGWPRVQPVRKDHELRTRAVKIGGVALAGAALGVVATLLIVRRR